MNGNPPVPEVECVDAGKGQAMAGLVPQEEGLIIQAVSPNPVQCGDIFFLKASGAVEDLELDIRELLKALPTKTDIQQLISAVEQSCQQAVEGLREDTRVLGHRVEALENGHEAIVQAAVDIQDTAKYHEEILNSHRDQLDDYENRDHRHNIRIKGDLK